MDVPQKICPGCISQFIKWLSTKIRDEVCDVCMRACIEMGTGFAAVPSSSGVHQSQDRDPSHQAEVTASSDVLEHVVEISHSIPAPTVSPTIVRGRDPSPRKRTGKGLVVLQLPMEELTIGTADHSLVNRTLCSACHDYLNFGEPYAINKQRFHVKKPSTTHFRCVDKMVLHAITSHKDYLAGTFWRNYGFDAEQIGHVLHVLQSNDKTGGQSRTDSPKAAQTSRHKAQSTSPNVVHRHVVPNLPKASQTSVDRMQFSPREATKGQLVLKIPRAHTACSLPPPSTQPKVELERDLIILSDDDDIEESISRSRKRVKRRGISMGSRVRSSERHFAAQLSFNHS